MPAFKAREYSGPVMKENVLIVMMDFSDSKQSTLKPEMGHYTPGTSASRNYYPKYTKEHYRDVFLQIVLKDLTANLIVQ